MEHIPWLTVLFAYLLGSISPGWFLVRLKTGGDVRGQGSGATGATNVGRMLGGRGFAIVLVLDMAKGALAAALPWLLGQGGVISGDLAPGTACVLAVVTGHVWPVFLKFHGGKGIGCFLGAWLVLAPLSLAAPFAAGLIFWKLLHKGLMMGALCGMVAQLPLLWLLTRDVNALLFASLTIALVLFAHRANFQKAFGQQVVQKNP
ncbi:glycerol-3-phosphate acyltransferase [Termitidicoccus mucosus]|uniref:glycerol-3-phosphate acyltransferase n=1 Tax=Termitidicoccus mucosus TaxID=1184151 RepID=UPI000837C5BD